MTVKEGFVALENIKQSSLKLSDTVARISALEGKLKGIVESQAQLEALIDRIAIAIENVDNSSVVLSKHYDAFVQEAQDIPDSITGTFKKADERFAQQNAKVAEIVNDLPKILEMAIEKKLQDVVTEMEGRLSEKLRDELKDTRQALRDAMDANARNVDGKIDAFARNIIAEMPRTILGKRGQ
jgi:predicted  nucleic acid-binding Zn-ribbon protein